MMGTLYIDKSGYEIRLDGNSIAFYLNGRREGAVPINPLKRVIIAGRCSVDTKVFHRLAERGIQVMMLTGRSLHFRCAVQGRLHNNGLIRLKQYGRASDPGFVNAVSIELVNRKIENQIMLLEQAITERPDCRRPLFQGIDRLVQTKEKILTIRPDIDSLRGYEGTASSAYFAAYASLFPASLGFSGRNRRPPRDPVNAMLSLCYTLLYGEITTEIYIAGLDPTIGFYHCFEYGRDSLSCDIEEPFRPEVDRFVWNLFREGLFTKRDFVTEKGGVYLKKKSRSRFYPCYERFAREIRKEIQKTLRSLIERLFNETDPLSI
ncbi:MAG TPA: CRISPR-associated endonuclease Cas1 [Nitrospirae bacterium]|nr:CRISPR-associated endonuclease Cas1 [Nitrospirota bacterium]